MLRSSLMTLSHFYIEALPHSQVKAFSHWWWWWWREMKDGRGGEGREGKGRYKTDKCRHVVSEFNHFWQGSRQAGTGRE